MDECRIDGQTEGAGFDELIEAWKDDLYWIRFFVRPCCPAPDLEGAKGMLDRLAGEVDARSDFTPEQKRELREAIDDGNLKKVYFADYEQETFLGFVTLFKVTAYGE